MFHVLLLSKAQTFFDSRSTNENLKVFGTRLRFEKRLLKKNIFTF